MVWVKGQTGNGRGRPLGSMLETTKQFIKLKERVAENADEGLDMLWENMKKNESWSYKIFFDLVPKRLKEQTANIRAAEGLSRIDALTKALNQFEELTHDEIMSELKALSNVELAKEQIQVENVLSIMSDEQIETLNNMYAAAKAAKESQIKQQ